MLTLRNKIGTHPADFAMMFMVLVWGFNFIIIKDAVDSIPPLAFNALRFAAGLPVLAIFAWHERSWMTLSLRDVLLIAGLVAIGPLIYQACVTLGIQRTTSTNTALLVATVPTWTAILSLGTGLVELRQQLVLGIALTFAGVAIVVVGNSGGGLSLSHDDLVGSGLVLTGAFAGAMSNVLNKPVVDRLGSMSLAIWKYVFTWLGMVVLSSPDLIHFTRSDIPTSTIPNILFSGIVSGVGGFLIVHYALREIGPTRMSSYMNFNPIVAALAGIALLSEPFTIWLVLGGGMTIAGVTLVRRNTYLRKKPTPEPPVPPVMSPAESDDADSKTAPKP